MSEEEDLLRMLGKLAAEEARDPELARWEALAHGRLGADEVAELEALAAEDLDSKKLLEAYRPIDEGSRARIAAHVVANVRASGRSAVPEALPSAPPELLLAARGRDEGRDEPRESAREAPRGARIYRFTAVAGSVALAACIALVAMRSLPRGPGLPGGPSGTGLPGYDVDVSGESDTRGPAAAPPDPSRGPCVLRASEQGSFELVARPAGSTAGAVDARAFLLRGGSLVPWVGALDVSPSGSVRILDASTRLVGASELRIVVGRREAMTPEAALEIARAGSAEASFRVLRCAIDGAPRP